MLLHVSPHLVRGWHPCRGCHTAHGGGGGALTGHSTRPDLSKLAPTVYCCRYAGILSAVGIHLADIVQEAQEPTATQLSAESLADLSARLQALADTAVGKLRAQGFDAQHIGVENFLNLRCAAQKAGLSRAPGGGGSGS
jgi:5-oxoprolinase (ATP-hydrolysing)